MNPVLIMAVIGIALGSGLVSFTAVSRSKLPAWSVISFTVTGLLIILSGILIGLGSIFSG